MDNIPARVVVDYVKVRLAASPIPLSVYWVKCLSDRQSYSDDLRQRLSAEPFAVIVLREARFVDANAIMVDLIELIEANRETIEEQSPENAERIGLILLARNELDVPQLSSPATLPQWFPVKPGQQTYVVIEDITRSTRVSLGAPEVGLAACIANLHELEDALIRRFREVAVATPSAGDRWMALWGLPGTWLSMLEAFKAEHAKCRYPAAFRPSLRNANSLVAQLWSISQTRTPDDLKAAKALSVAAGLDDCAPVEDTLATLLRRPVNRPTLGGVLARNILCTVQVACQMSTAAAHADAYPTYPLSLLRSQVDDVGRGLVNMTASLRAAPPL